MRLWHIDLIPYLPKSQWLAQWRELNSIYKKPEDHVLINYIYDYDKVYLYNYSKTLLQEMNKRNINIHYSSLKNFDNCFKELNWFEKQDNLKNPHVFNEHNNEYLTICYYNLKEKYIRGQKDFTDEVWNKLEEFYKRRINE